jgi:hypothetical protein
MKGRSKEAGGPRPRRTFTYPAKAPRPRLFEAQVETEANIVVRRGPAMGGYTAARGRRRLPSQNH